MDVRKPLVWLAAHGAAAKDACWSLLAELRGAGIVADMDLSGRSMKAQLKMAEREAAKFCVVIGDTELAAEQVNLKDMANREQSSVGRKEIWRGWWAWRVGEGLNMIGI